MLGYYLKMDQSVIYNGNYSDSLTLTGTCYTDIGQTALFNLTGYTLTIRMYRDGGIIDTYNQTASITSAAGGTWNKAITSGTLPTPGLYLIDIALSKSGTLVSNLNRVELLVKRGPTA